MFARILCRFVLFLGLSVPAVTATTLPIGAQPGRPAATASFDRSRFPADRQKLDALRATGFPRLGANYEVLRPGIGNYNCIAWSLGITDRWVWPGTSLQAFDTLNARFGYRRINGPDYRLQPGVERIVLYAKQVNGRFEATHQARQMADGTWTSKLGKMALIRHATPEALSGPSYGQPVAVYSRTKGQAGLR